MSEPVHGFAAREWPLNAWYAVASSGELGRDLLPRTICGKPLVLYRTEAGSPVALDDACWHRLVPLSRGELVGDEVKCGYHGLRFDPAGRCTFMPSQETINPAAVVRSYPLVELHGWVWAWLGDAALADVALVPDLHWNDDPAWAGGGRVIHVEANYKLVVDNLMDLTHETFVHSTSIGNAAVAEAPFEVTHGPRSVTVTRWMLDIEPPPLWARHYERKFGRDPGRVDRWQIVHFQPPATVAIDVGVAPTGAGAPEGDRSQGVERWVLNTMTPETERTTHYFWASARNYGLDDAALTEEAVAAIAGVFREDEEILAAQQRAIDANPDKEFYNLNIDAGAMWARRLVDGLVAAES